VPDAVRPPGGEAALRLDVGALRNPQLADRFFCEVLDFYATERAQTSLKDWSEILRAGQLFAMDDVYWARGSSTCSAS